MLMPVTQIDMLDPHIEHCIRYHSVLSTKMDHWRYMKGHKTHTMGMPLWSINELQRRRVI